jgi:hypothetical protein
MPLSVLDHVFCVVWHGNDGQTTCFARLGESRLLAEPPIATCAATKMCPNPLPYTFANPPYNDTNNSSYTDTNS